MIELFKASDKYDVPGLLRECIHIFHKITEARHVAYLLQVCSLDDEFRRYLVYLKYWTLDLNPLIVHAKVLFPPTVIILRLLWSFFALSPIYP